jgi:hypothetical protein
MSAFAQSGHWRLGIAAVQTDPEPHFVDRKSPAVIASLSKAGASDVEEFDSDREPCSTANRRTNPSLRLFALPERSWRGGSYEPRRS